MAFMAKKKRYKFNVHCRLEELTDVPFVSAVLFAKVRLLDGKGFQEYSTREEVRDHAVRWNAPFEFVCKMCANANTGVLEPALLRISVRKECKGGRSYQKLGFCDVNLAELAGSGETVRRCLLEGYDPRRRQDNSVLRLRVRMDMVAGDPLFKVPSPSLKHRPIAAEGGADAADSGAETAAPEPDDCAASVASAGSSGFGSLPKKRAVYSSEHGGGALSSLSTCEAVESEPGATDTTDGHAAATAAGCAACGGPQAHTHSRNSSNTSGDMSSKASGYGSSSQQSQHSRQSSEGEPAPPPTAHHASPTSPDNSSLYRTPDCTVARTADTPDVFRDTVVTWRNALDNRTSFDTPRNSRQEKRNTPDVVPVSSPEYTIFASYFSKKSITAVIRPIVGFQKHKSLNTLPDCIQKREEALFHDFPFLTPLAHRKGSLVQRMEEWVPSGWHSELLALHTSTPETAKTERGVLRPESGVIRPESRGFRPEPGVRRPECGVNRPDSGVRRHGLLRNPSSGSVAAPASEGGSLERGKPPRKHKPPAGAAPPGDEPHAPTRVENTRVNPDSLIEELLKATNLEQAVEDSAETSGLQLFIARDGTAALGSRQVKQQSRHNYQRVVVQPAGADHR